MIATVVSGEAELTWGFVLIDVGITLGAALVAMALSQLVLGRTTPRH